MKKTKKMALLLLSVVLVFTMAFSGVMTVNAAETVDSASVNNVYKAGLLEALKISKVSGVGVTEWTGNLTRGEAAFLVAGLIKLDRAKKPTIFTDVSQDAFYEGSVASLYNEGIVVRSWGSKKYKPDEAISYADFITLICKALGYTGFAESNGGYPSGYYTAAKKFKITKGISSEANTAALNKAYVPQILLNALEAYYFTRGEIDKEGNVSAAISGTVLEDLYGAYTFSGTLVEVGAYSVEDHFADDNQIVVKDEAGQFKIFKNPGSVEEFKNLLGCDVTLYCENEGNGVIYIYPTTENSFLTIDGEKIKASATSDRITYEDEDGKEVKAKLSADRIITYNGSVTRNPNFKPELGFVELVDNDGDERYDIIKVTEYKVCEVTGVDSYEGTVSFNEVLSGKQITVDTDSDYEYSVITSTNNKKVKLSNFTSDSIVLVARNDETDNPITNIVLCNTTVKGKVTSLDDEEVGVDGTAQILSEYVFNNFGQDYSTSDIITVYKDSWGRVFYYKVEAYDPAADGLKYAVLLNIEQSKYSYSNPEWEFELFTQDCAHVYIPAASEKFKLNDTTYKTFKDNADVILKKLSDYLPVENGNSATNTANLATHNYQVIKYSIVDGAIKEVKTAEDWGGEYRLPRIGEGFNKWKSTSGLMFLSMGAFGNGDSKFIRLADKPVWFSIFEDEKGRFDEEESRANVGKPSADNDKTFSDPIYFYDTDKGGLAHCYMVSTRDAKSRGLNKASGGSVSGSDSGSFFVVTKLMRGKNADDDEGYYVQGFLAGKIKTYFITDEDYEKTMKKVAVAYGTTVGALDPFTQNPFTVGSMMRIITAGSNMVCVTANYDADTRAASVFTRSELENIDWAKYGACGSAFTSKSYRAGTNVLIDYVILARVVYNKNGTVYISGSTDISPTGSRCMTLKTGGSIFRYHFDKSGEDMLTAASWSDLRESDIESGVANGSTLLIHAKDGNITEAYILD